MRYYNEQEKKLVIQMMDLGINISCKGFNYILDAVQIIHDTNDNVKITWLYEKIAHVNNTRYSRVERDIRTEIERIYNTNSNIPQILIANPNNGKLTNGEFLYRLSYWLYNDGKLL